MLANEVVHANYERRSQLVHAEVFRVAKAEPLIPLQFLPHGEEKPLNVTRCRCAKVGLSEDRFPLGFHDLWDAVFAVLRELIGIERIFENLPLGRVGETAALAEEGFDVPDIGAVRVGGNLDVAFNAAGDVPNEIFAGIPIATANASTFVAFTNRSASSGSVSN